MADDSRAMKSKLTSREFYDVAQVIKHLTDRAGRRTQDNRRNQAPRINQGKDITIMVTVKCSEFVKRQVQNSPFSYFNGSWGQLEDLVAQNFDTYVPGYKEGVRLVNVPAKAFYSGIVAITPETELIAKFAPRREGEESVLGIYARGQKLPAKNVDIVIYSKDVLAENKENSTDADWEIVSINARITDEPTPMDPVTMMRNQLNLPGGTKGDFSGLDFAMSIYFWSKHANCL